MSHRTLASGIVDPRSLRWISVHDLVPPTRAGTVVDPEELRAQRYLEECYIVPAFMTPETNHGCHLCSDAPRYSPDPAVTDGTWWFAFGVAHYLRVHRYSLPDLVLKDLRERDFVVPHFERS